MSDLDQRIYDALDRADGAKDREIVGRFLLGEQPLTDEVVRALARALFCTSEAVKMLRDGYLKP